MNTDYYIYTKKLIESGDFISVHSTLKDLEDSIWFDSEHATNEIMRAYND